MKKFLTISVVVTLLHFVEDLLLIGFGRFTDLNIFLIAFGGVVFGFMLGGLSRLKFVKKFIADGD